MENPLKTFAILAALASQPLAANAQGTTPDAAPPMAGSSDMMGMMGMMGGDGSMKMDGTQMDGMMDRMMQMMMMMQMMQMTQMMGACEKMMGDMSMMDKETDPMMNAPATPAPKG